MTENIPLYDIRPDVEGPKSHLESMPGKFDWIFVIEKITTTRLIPISFHEQHDWSRIDELLQTRV